MNFSYFLLFIKSWWLWKHIILLVTYFAITYCYMSMTEKAWLQFVVKQKTANWQYLVLHICRLQQFRYGWMCPVHGRLAHFTVLILMSGLLYGALWSVTGKEALPGGNLFALSVLFIACSIAGFLIGKIRLPPLLGKYAVEELCEYGATENTRPENARPENVVRSKMLTVPHFPVPHFPPQHFDATFSNPAVWCYIFHPSSFMSRIFSILWI